MPNKMITIATDFSQFPAGRYVTDGPNSGERFREELLYPALQNKDNHVIVNMDGALGYGSSFLEEAFGGLIRKHNLRLSNLKERLVVRCSVPLYVSRVWQYIEEEDARH